MTTQEDMRRDYMDLVDVRIAQARARLVRYESTRYGVPDKRVVDDVDASVGHVAAQKEQVLTDLQLIAMERWYASNPPETRGLPHVLAQRDAILGTDVRELAAGSVHPPGWDDRLVSGKRMVLERGDDIEPGVALD